MTENRDSLFQEDIESISKFVDSLDLSGSTVLVTGATGLLGSQICMGLLESARRFNNGIHVIAAVRNREKAAKVFTGYEDEIQILDWNLSSELQYDGPVDYIVHTACPTSSKYFVSNPVETIWSILGGTNHALRFAMEKKVSGFLYLSSLEIYGKPAEGSEALAEDGYGFLDSTSVRSSYSEGKRLAECLCASYAKEYDVPARIVRLSQTFGPGVRYDDGRVFAEFARCAIEGHDIVLHTQGHTVRNYCYSADAAKAILLVLARGENGEAYNVANPDTACSIREMAELVSGLGDQPVKVRVEIPEDAEQFGYNPEMKIKLDPTKVRKLGWKPEIGLREMFERLIRSMRFERSEQ
jgi:UDP-glucuronate decarboxylase